MMVGMANKYKPDMSEKQRRDPEHRFAWVQCSSNLETRQPPLLITVEMNPEPNACFFAGASPELCSNREASFHKKVDFLLKLKDIEFYWSITGADAVFIGNAGINVGATFGRKTG
jgi:hypothetical protein